MILKVLKEKSNQKYVDRLLNSRNVTLNNSKVQSIGVILNNDEFSDFEAFRQFFKMLNLQPNRTKIIAMLEDPLQSNEHWDTYFNSKDFGWKGKLKNMDIQTFVDRKFDLLISYYKKESLELNIVTAASNATFKVGLSTADSRLYDLMIDVDPKDFSVFKEELKKYLTVLNKI